MEIDRRGPCWPTMCLCLIAAAMLAGATATAAYAEPAPAVDRVAEMLRAGQEPVRIVCFGDSITGVYYHTGGRRAWCDMLGIALQRTCPNAKIEMINAGISGHTTTAGLKRIEGDVIAKKPHLVVVMFGMNDVCAQHPEQFRANLHEIVRRCRQAGAAVVLCTPNSVYPNERRPMEWLATYAQVVRDVAEKESVPLADCFADYEALRAENATAWMLLMSETIHPCMLGHKRFAELISKTITGEPVSLDDAPPPDDALKFTLARMSAGQPVKVVAMPPYDAIVPQVLGALFPGAKVDVTPWPIAGQSLAQIEAWGKGIRPMRPHLVVVAVPADATAETEEAYIRSYHWVLNWGIHFGRASWDLVAILPSVTGPVEPEALARENLSRQIIIGKDYRPVERAEGDLRPAPELVRDWVDALRQR